METRVTESLYESYLAALLAGDQATCSRTVQELAIGCDLQDLYLNLFQRSLYEVGDLWEQHRVSVAREHLVTAITERLMALLQPQVFGGARERSLVVACVPDELHQIGARMVADLAELHGWRGYFLGANTPVDSLLDMIDRLNPDLLGLSLSIRGNLQNLIRTLDAVSGAFPAQPVLVGGQAFNPRWGEATPLDRYPGVRQVASIDQLQRELTGNAQH